MNEWIQTATTSLGTSSFKRIWYARITEIAYVVYIILWLKTATCTIKEHHYKGYFIKDIRINWKIIQL